jgi:mRNA interferase MazF
MSRRGEVVVVDFPFTDTGQSKLRPAVVVRNDRDNRRLRKTVVAMVTGNLRRAGDPSHLRVDPGTAEGASSGLHVPSPVSCNNLFTVEQASILRTLGRLSDVLKQRLNICLMAALELP